MEFTQPNPSQTAQEAIAKAEQLGIPFGWNDEAFNYIQSKKTADDPFWYNWAFVIVGWLISAVATLFGAPFWFDALQKFVQLRGAGSK